MRRLFLLIGPSGFSGSREEERKQYIGEESFQRARGFRLKKELRERSPGFFFGV